MAPVQVAVMALAAVFLIRQRSSSIASRKLPARLDRKHLIHVFQEFLIRKVKKAETTISKLVRLTRGKHRCVSKRLGAALACKLVQ